MRRSAVLCSICVVLSLALADGWSTTSHARQANQQKKQQRKKGGGNPDRKDDVVGAIWTFRAVRGSEVEAGQFRVYQYEVFRGPRKVGVVKPKDEDETTLVIDGYPKLNGSVVLRKTGRMPPVWAGMLEQDDGSKWRLTVQMKDR